MIRPNSILCLCSLEPGERYLSELLRNRITDLLQNNVLYSLERRCMAFLRFLSEEIANIQGSIAGRRDILQVNILIRISCDHRSLVGFRSEQMHLSKNVPRQEERAWMYMCVGHVPKGFSTDRAQVYLHCFALDCATHHLFHPYGTHSIETKEDLELMEELSYHDSLKRKSMQSTCIIRDH